VLIPHHRQIYYRSISLRACGMETRNAPAASWAAILGLASIHSTARGLGNPLATKSNSSYVCPTKIIDRFHKRLSDDIYDTRRIRISSLECGKARNDD
jgi:hypothetical protein